MAPRKFLRMAAMVELGARASALCLSLAHTVSDQGTRAYASPFLGGLFDAANTPKDRRPSSGMCGYLFVLFGAVPTMTCKFLLMCALEAIHFWRRKYGDKAPALPPE